MAWLRPTRTVLVALALLIAVLQPLLHAHPHTGAMELDAPGLHLPLGAVMTLDADRAPEPPPAIVVGDGARPLDLPALLDSRGVALHLPDSAPTQPPSATAPPGARHTARLLKTPRGPPLA